MKARIGSSMTSGTDSRRAKMIVPIVGLAFFAVVGAACGSSSASPTTTGPGGTKQYLSESGTGNKVLEAMTYPAATTVSWTFDCQTPATTGTFALTTTKSGKAPVSLTSQTGLGGGGHKPMAGAGKYGFGVTTTCGWKVTVGSTPTSPIKSDVSTTTAAPVKPAATVPAKVKTSGTKAKATTPAT